MMQPETVDCLLRSHLERKGLLSESSSSWTVKYSKLGGRGLFVTRDFQQGELIFIDAPLIIGPRCYKKYLPMCVNCYKVDCPLFPCDRGCGLPVCSNACENSPDHIRLECDYLRSLKPTCGSMWSTDLLQTVVPIRSLSLSKDEKKLLYSFECHPENQIGREVELLKGNVSVNPTEEEESLMLRVSRVMETTCFETAKPSSKSSASLRALFPLGALQNHSCTPNTRHHFDANQRVFVTAALPIGKGEEITMSYVDLLWDTTLRRSFLNATKYFSCKCKRCADKTERGSMIGALKCASDDCSGDLLPEDPLNFNSPWICDKCELRISGRQMKSIRSGIGAVIEEVQYESPRRILRFIEKELSVLIPATNFTMMDMMFRIVSLFGRTEELSWEDLSDRELNVKSEYCKKLLKMLDVLGCGDCKKKGLILYELYCTNEEKLSRLACRPKNACGFSETGLVDNEFIFRKASELLQKDIAAPSDYLCKIRESRESRTF